ncbi:helix-turn-helix domain-containing protein [Streptomyces silvisoli]|uniref:Helix-turn-helix domain-containing protein n=1 Tax=Streptomyces silvisoli TaxID=3034235 RepID=A0ABT5ZSI4_9ACTN|nr:helix-turn-helix domain-containing protein [Streptomyces silvisoli]MDF3292611.1 helix-turn-helix domain-containing protein [Streptomyces silvisoli]
MLLRLAYLAVTNAFAALRLLPMSDRAKDAEILALRHQITVLERQLGADRLKFRPEDQAFLAALLVPLPRQVLRRLRLLVRPDTVLRWHRDVSKQRHARTCRTKRPGRPPTLRSIRILILRLVHENPSWSYRRVHGELATLGIKVAASTVWEILQAEGIDPAPDRAATTWAGFLRSQADALLACDFIETVTLTGQRQYILAVIEHATRRIRILGTTTHPNANRVAQAARNLVMDLEDAHVTVTYLIRDRDAKFSCRHEFLDRTLVWNERHLHHILRQFELHHNAHRPHQAMNQAAPLRAVPEPLDSGQASHMNIRRRDRVSGVIHEFHHAA